MFKSCLRNEDAFISLGLSVWIYKLEVMNYELVNSKVLLPLLPLLHFALLHFKLSSP